MPSRHPNPACQDFPPHEFGQLASQHMYVCARKWLIWLERYGSPIRQKKHWRPDIGLYEVIRKLSANVALMASICDLSFPWCVFVLAAIAIRRVRRTDQPSVHALGSEAFWSSTSYPDGDTCSQELV
jgi:hypothetical protein